jgi:uncharacterized protein YegL/cellulose biosynthesis protein BcsQ
LLSAEEDQEGVVKDWKDCVLDLSLTAHRLLHLIPAGRRDESYFLRLRNLDVDRIYRNKGGYRLETMRSEWKSAYDFVLIDSRTGITDIGGICTIQFPDYLVMVFVANRQNVEGTRDTADAIQRAKERLPFDRYALPIVPIISRFDSSEEFIVSQEWLTLIETRMHHLYRDWIPTSVSVREFIEATKLPYIPYFSFGEKLPLMEQGTRDATGLGYAYESLSSLVANRFERLGEFLTDRSGYVRIASQRGTSRDSPELIENHETRLPLVLLLDVSGSMAGPRITELSRALTNFAGQIRNNPAMGRTLDIAIVAFGSRVQVIQDFTRGYDFYPPVLQVEGSTSTGAALNVGIDLLRDRIDFYKMHSVDYYRPWMILISDGVPTDDWRSAAIRVAAEEKSRKLSFFQIAVGDEDDTFPDAISSKRRPLKLQGLDFAELFDWISSSTFLVANSTDSVSSRLAPIGWAQLDEWQ